MLTRCSILYFWILISLLCSCNSDTTAPETVNASDSTIITTSPAPERGNFFSAEEQKVLSTYFSTTLIDELSDNMYAFQDATSDKALESAYVTGETLQATLEKLVTIDGYEASEALAVLDPVMQFYAASCVAECTEFTYVYDVKALQKKAISTKGKSDDTYAALLEMACGDYDSRVRTRYKFFELMWDYGGGSLLGNGLCQQFLQKSWVHIQNTPLFRKQINTLREACLLDMNHPMYMSSQDQVIAELKAILDAKILGTEEQPRVEKILAAVETGTLEGVAIQFGCKDPNSNCNFGG